MAHVKYIYMTGFVKISPKGIRIEIYFIPTCSDVRYVSKYRNTRDVSQYDTAMPVY